MKPKVSIYTVARRLGCIYWNLVMKYMTAKELIGWYSICEFVIYEQWHISLSVELTNKLMI